MLMNKIEKMYKNAGVKKIELDYPDNFEPFYPEFTADKQLNIIKGFAQGYPLGFAYGCYQTYSFEEGLAKCINDIWKDLTEEDKQQIKEILESNGN